MASVCLSGRVGELTWGLKAFSRLFSQLSSISLAPLCPGMFSVSSGLLFRGAETLIPTSLNFWLQHSLPSRVFSPSFLKGFSSLLTAGLAWIKSSTGKGLSVREGEGPGPDTP